MKSEEKKRKKLVAGGCESFHFGFWSSRKRYSFQRAENLLTRLLGE